MLVPLAAATVDRCGAKAATLASLLNAGFPVPDGVVVPFAACASYCDALGDTGAPPGDALMNALGEWLTSAGDPPVAVRSSASDEDTAHASAAGLHDTFLAVQGLAAVAHAVRSCWASLGSPRATAFRNTSKPLMAVIVQRQLDSDVSGVMFTPAEAKDPTLIEASWGLGPSVVEGRVTPDLYRVSPDGSVTRKIANKPTYLARTNRNLAVHQVPAIDRTRPALSDATAVRLAHLGHEISTLLGAPQDIEWALEAGTLWLLQSRPVTAHPPSVTVRSIPTRPPRVSSPTSAAAPRVGTPASHGTATGPARIVRGPGDFAQVCPGDILICPFTDPAWTPLLTIVAGVVTECGGILSHAAIIAREQGIPAVVGVPRATIDLTNGAKITINGSTGAIQP